MGSLARNSKRTPGARSLRPSSNVQRKPIPPRTLLTDLRLRLQVVVACAAVVAVALKAQRADGDEDAAAALQRCVCDPLAARIELIETAPAIGGAS